MSEQIPQIPPAADGSLGRQVIAALAATQREHRSVDVIAAELREKRAEHAALMPKVEREGKLVERQRDRIAKAQMKWKVENPDEPFDPEEFDPPLRPYVANPELCDRFHALHYVIHDVEQELAAAKKARAMGVA